MLLSLLSAELYVNKKHGDGVLKAFIFHVSVAVTHLQQMEVSSVLTFRQPSTKSCTALEFEQHVCQQGDGGTREWPDSPQGLTATNVPVCQALMGNNGYRSITAVGWAARDWGGGIGVTSSDGSLHPWTDRTLRQSICRQRVGAESGDTGQMISYRKVRTEADSLSMKLLAMTEWLFPYYYFSIGVKPRGQGQMTVKEDFSLK